MNKNYINLGQYNNRHVIKHVTLKLWTISTLDEILLNVYGIIINLRHYLGL